MFLFLKNIKGKLFLFLPALSHPWISYVNKSQEISSEQYPSNIPVENAHCKGWVDVMPSHEDCKNP